MVVRSCARSCVRSRVLNKCMVAFASIYSLLFRYAGHEGLCAFLHAHEKRGVVAAGHAETSAILQEPAL